MASDKLALLRNHPLFRDLPSTAIEKLGSYMGRRIVARGANIFSKGDPGTGLMGVLSGSVKISVRLADGRDLVLNIVREGEIFGDMALLDGRPRSADASAMSDCELVIMERRDFIPFLRSQPDVTLKLMEILCLRLRRTNDQLKDVAFMNLSIRLAKTLLRLAEDGGKSAPSGKMKITQQEISEIVGRSRESVNKQLRAWKKRGWIELQWGALTVLKPDKLAEVVADGLEFDPS
jgi:CRP/FNR family transcriptional regulator, cyclic AMP receptor protein